MKAPQNTKDLILLVDADSIVFGAGFAAEKKEYTVSFGPEQPYPISVKFQYKKDVNSFLEETELKEGEYELTGVRVLQPLRNALANAKTMVSHVREKLGSNTLELWLTGEDNFRYDLATIQPYKGNRVDAERPSYEAEVREYLTKQWGAHVTKGQEADDAVTIRHMELWPNAVIVSADKDLDTVPGWHSKIKNPELYWVSHEEALRNFYRQFITGDTSDNIRGIPGKGIVAAKKLVSDNINDEEEMFWAVFWAYYEYHLDRLNEIPKSDDLQHGVLIENVIDEVRETGQLLHMRRIPGELWELPIDDRNIIDRAYCGFDTIKEVRESRK